MRIRRRNKSTKKRRDKTKGEGECVRIFWKQPVFLLEFTRAIFRHGEKERGEGEEAETDRQTDR